MDSNDPSNLSEERQRLEPYLKMIHTILGGTASMRRAGAMYLPPHPNETQGAYQARLERTTLLNVLEDSIDNACARLFDEQVKLAGEIPPELAEWAKNIDLAGSTLHEFCDQAMHHALADGQVHILVDFPSAVPLATGNLDGFGGDAAFGAGGGGGFRDGVTAGGVTGNGLGARRGARRSGQPYYGGVYQGEGFMPDQTGNGLNARRASYGGEFVGYDDHGNAVYDQAYDENGNPLRMDRGGGAVDADFEDIETGRELSPYGPSADPASLPRMTLAEERALGVRPYLCLVPHTNLLAIYTARIGGETIVTHARILEEDVVREGFAEKRVKRVRVLEPGRWEVWQQDETGGGWFVSDSGELRKSATELWDRVPLFTFSTGKHKGTFEVKPPFLDLAYKNIEHWQSSSDQRNILAQARFPMLAVSGFEGEIQTPMGDMDDDGPEIAGPLPFIIGPNTVLTTGDASGKWYYVEPQGAAIEHGSKDLDRLEREMRVMGLEPLMPEQNRMGTATEAGIDEAKARSPLEEWARRLEMRMNLALKTMLEWAGLFGEPAVSFKGKVQVGPNASAEFSNLTQMRMTGVLSKLTLLEEAKRRGYLAPTFDPMEELARLVVEGPMGDVGPYLGLPPSDPYGGQGMLPPPG